MKEIKACIFDLDGVIVDTAKYHYLAWKRLAHELGFDFSEEDNERLKGISRMASLDILLEVGKIVLDSEVKHSLAEKKNQWYVEYVSKITEDEILPGIKAFIEGLRQSGTKIALGSASKNANIILRNLKLMEYFDAIIDGNKALKAKPDPEVFLMAAEELGVLPKHCVVFEDAQAGVKAAKSAQMLCIGVGSPEQLYEADFVISDFTSLGFEVASLFQVGKKKGA